MYDAMMAGTLAQCLSDSMHITMKGVNHEGHYRQSAEFGGIIKKNSGSGHQFSMTIICMKLICPEDSLIRNIQGSGL